MNYLNKIQLPENISSLNDISDDNDNSINDLIEYLFTKKKFDEKVILKIYKTFFEKKLNEKIKENYFDLITKFSNLILPIIIKSKHPRQGIYQLLRLVDLINPNFEFIESLIKNTFAHKKISEILTFSGHATTLLSSDKNLLEILDPYYKIKLNKNINNFKNEFNKINLSNDEETILNKLRKIHRKFKFQIIVSIITDEIRVEEAAHEFYLLAYSTLEKAKDISVDLISKKNNFNRIMLDDFGILAYGRFAQNLMTSNSDLDLVFIFPDKNENFPIKKKYQTFYSQISQKIISVLSSKTSENFLYEVDTKLGPKQGFSNMCCTISEFKRFHEDGTFSWEKMALRKSKLISVDTTFQQDLNKFIDRLKQRAIDKKSLINEIKKMRRISDKPETNSIKKNSIDRKVLNWYETKYSLGGQRDIEFLEFFYHDVYTINQIENLDEKKLFIKKSKLFYSVIDQYVNLTFSKTKPNTLTSQILKRLQSNLNINDLGSLKLKLKTNKMEINKYLLEIIDYKHN